MRNYLSFKRKDFISSIILLFLSASFFVLMWNPEIELTNQAIPYLVVISILGILVAQLFSLNKTETSKSRSYPVNNFLVRVCILLYFLLILYFSWEFGTEIAELNREKGILVK
jgi:NADH:ubiquinone oxidoreductase subunit 6 (subunit J)